MDSNIGTVRLRCECLCSTVEVDKFKWDDGDINYNIAFCDSCTNWGMNTLWQRFKAAGYMLTRKKVSHADIWIEDEERMREFVEQLRELLDR